MSYSEWSDFAYYRTNDIATYLGVEYIALQPNRNVPPTGLAPNWAQLATGTGIQSINALTNPSIVLSSPNNSLSVGSVAPDTITLQTNLTYQTGDLTSSLPTQTNIVAGTSSTNVPFVSRLQYINPSLVAPVSPNIPVYVEFDPPAGQSPPALVRWLEAHWFKQDPNPNLDQDKYFYMETGDGFTRLGSEWKGFLAQSIALNAQNVVLETGQGATSGLYFKSGALNGNLYQDALGDLYWNGTKLN